MSQTSLSEPTPDSQIELSVVLTAHNRAELVPEMLESLSSQEWADGNWEIVLVDNNSTDETAAILYEWAERMPVPARVLHATEHNNCAYARNAGVASSTGTNIALLDDDDVLGDGWVQAMGQALRHHEFVASRCDYQLLNDPREAKHYDFQTSRLGRHFGTEVVDGAGSGFNRRLWERVGGNDLTIGFSEDADLSLRIARLKEPVQPHFVSDAVCFVRLRTTLKSAFTRGVRRGRCQVSLYQRHGEHFEVQRDSAVVTAGRWLRLVPQMRWLLTPQTQGLWLEALGRRIGRLQESIRTTTWYP